MGKQVAKRGAAAIEREARKEAAMKAAKKEIKKRRTGHFFYSCNCIECGHPRTIPGKLCAACREKALNGEFKPEPKLI